MAARLVFLETDRELPSLNRGWRTPDPSPTREAAGLLGWDLKLCIAEAWSMEDGSTRGRSMVTTDWTSRTPSPSPTLQQLPFHSANMCVQAMEDRMSTPRMQPKLRSEEAFSVEDGSTSGGSMVPTDWTSRTPSPSPTRQQLPFHATQMCAQAVEDQMPTPRMQPLSLSFLLSSESNAVEVEAPPMPSKEPRPQKAPKAQKAKQKETKGENGKDTASETSMECMPTVTVSIGSVGHPVTCAEACKYVMKKNRGCKDAAACNRCHLCEWRKRGPRKAKDVPSSPSDPPSAQPDVPSAQLEQQKALNFSTPSDIVKGHMT